jgi:uncharacterized DUF497 family protein
VLVEWDPAKATGNLRKHGVDFREAVTALEDPLATTYPDPDHSAEEYRFVTMGLSARRRMLVVAHADRRGVVRIISARRATTRERRFHEEGK